jgi:hypothetical protein
MCLNFEQDTSGHKPFLVQLGRTVIYIIVRIFFFTGLDHQEKDDAGEYCECLD